MPPSRAARAWEDDEPYERAEPRLAEVHPFPQRRTIQIRGQVPPPRRAARTGSRRPARRRRERLAARPDRAAGWAVLLGLFLVLVAAASSHAATFGARTLGARTNGEDVRVLHAFERGGRFLSARVVDRGRYVDGITLVVTRRTAHALGLRGTDAVRLRH